MAHQLGVIRNNTYTRHHKIINKSTKIAVLLKKNDNLRSVFSGIVELWNSEIVKQWNSRIVKQ